MQYPGQVPLTAFESYNNGRLCSKESRLSREDHRQSGEWTVGGVM